MDAESDRRGEALSRADLFAASAALACLVVVALEAVLWTTTRVFVRNFSVAGPNATAALSLLLVTGWSLAAAGRLDPGAAGWYLAGAALLCGFAGSLAESAVLAGLGGAAMVTAATPLLAGLLDTLGGRAIAPVGAGLLGDIALRAALGTAPPYATTAGTALFAGVVLAAAALPAALVRGETDPESLSTGGPAVAPVFALLFLGAGFLAYPHVVARWALRSYPATLLAGVVGILGGLAVCRARGVARGPALVGWAALYLGGVAVVLYGTAPVTTAGYGLAWTAAIVLLAAGIDRAGTRDGSGAARLVGVQLLALALLSGYVAASNWAFLPAPLELTRGLATEFLLALHAVLPASVLLFRPAEASRVPAARAGRRSLLGTLAVGTLSPFALAARRLRYDPAGPPERAEGPIRVMAYNLHLFFEEGRSGQYGLEAVASVIDDSDPDVVAVSESDGCRPLAGNVDGLRWLGRRLGYHTAFGAPARVRGYGVGLLSRWPIDDVEVIELPVSRSPPRIAVTATVRAPTGPLAVLATHFMTEKPGDVRDQQAERVVEFAADHDRAVLLGDFNVDPEPSEPAYRVLSSSLTDAWRAAERTDGGPETFSAADPRRRIDYVWLQGEWSVRRASVVGGPAASDHRAVLADVEPADDTG